MRRKLLLVLVLLTLALPAVAQQDPAVTVHVVQRGENLFRIALRYGLTVEDIAQANGITNVASIAVGQRLLIPLEPAPVVVPPTTHSVAPGETLESIAATYGVSVDELVALNGIANPNALYIGQNLTIRPEAETAASVPETEAEAELQSIGVDPNAPTLTHTIGAGETLFSIAQQYGVSVEAIQAVNGIANASMIYAGQPIIVPGVEGAALELTSLLPPVLTGFDVQPPVLTQGKTGRVIITTVSPSMLRASFLERELPVAVLDGGLRHQLYIGVPVATAVGVYPLTLTVLDAAAQTTTFTANLNVTAGNYGTQFVTIAGEKAVLLSQAADDNETSVLRSVAQGFSPEAYFTGPLSLPVAAPMNAIFGATRSYNSSYASVHSGADFAAPPGAPVYAAAGGRVVLADTLVIRGTTVMIDHGWGIYSLYAHLSDRSVSLGNFVQAGALIGTVGTTGRSTGAHLHWEVWVNGTVVDPMQWVSQAFP